jgi:hypothetical protein
VYDEGVTPQELNTRERGKEGTYVYIYIYMGGRGGWEGGAGEREGEE